MKIIVDLAFLTNFFLSEEDSDRYVYLKRLLTSQDSPAEIVVNFDFEEAYNDPEKRILFRKIAQKLPKLDREILFKSQSKEFYETREAKLFFIDSTPLDMEQFGCFSITSHCLEKAENLLQTQDLRVNDPKRDWSFLSTFKAPCNAIILTDNYLFSSDLDYENIVSILKSLMPTRLSIDFDLTIIGFDPKQAHKSIQDQHNNLLSRLSDLPYHINLTIIREDHHGRYIHTNYTRFQSEKGFGLFKNRKISPNNETSISFGSVFSFTKNSYQTRNSEIEKCTKINQVERMADRFSGSKTNRLLS